MSADIGSMLKMIRTLGDEGFVDALANVEEIVQDVNETLDRVEEIETEAGQAVQEANQALDAVDQRLSKVDETISLLEAKIEAAFSVGFFFFAISMYLDGEFILAGALAFMGLLGAGSLLVTIATMPQIQRLRQLSRFATDQVDLEPFDDGDERRRRRTRNREQAVDSDRSQEPADPETPQDQGTASPQEQGRSSRRRDRSRKE